MDLNRCKAQLFNQARYVYAVNRILYHLKWNILPVAVMLILLGWVSLQAGKLIDASKQSSVPSVEMDK